MHDQIVRDLRDVETERGARVLFACESGSRAWGFASPDSDWDVRFIYVKPAEAYLTIGNPRDVIEAMLPNDIDLAGWDLRKALALLRKSNPSLIEWLQSPIVYCEDAEFMTRFRALADKCLSPERLLHHYRSMARGNFQTYLQGDSVKHKKYLYVLRPLLACQWIQEHLTAPPVLFDDLVSACLKDSNVAEALQRLLAIKTTSSELDAGPPIAELNDYIAAELDHLAEVKLAPMEQVDIEVLNGFFRAEIQRTS